MTPVRFLDTNILLYRISRDPAEITKRQRATDLLEHDDNALSAQVLAEFYAQATRQSRPDALSHETAATLIKAWARFPVQPVSLAIVMEGIRIRGAYGFSYWDSAIIAAAIAIGCSELCTEDLSHGREIEGLRIVNPFL
ncbi:MAG: PIN domain-containing protein [Acetobacteraceae bacterium]|nr:PIN domain-containing protein [Pseudomonadota bacterium]